MACERGVELEKVGDCYVARLCGLMDRLLGDRLLELLRGQLVQGMPLVIDFGQVNLIDSAGLGALLNVRLLLKQNRGRLILAGLGGNPLEVLTWSQLHRIFDIRDTVKQALAELATNSEQAD